MGRLGSAQRCKVAAEIANIDRTYFVSLLIAEEASEVLNSGPCGPRPQSDLPGSHQGLGASGTFAHNGERLDKELRLKGEVATCDGM